MLPINSRGGGEPSKQHRTRLACDFKLFRRPEAAPDLLVTLPKPVPTIETPAPLEARGGNGCKGEKRLTALPLPNVIGSVLGEMRMRFLKKYQIKKVPEFVLP